MKLPETQFNERGIVPTLRRAAGEGRGAATENCDHIHHGGKPRGV